MLKRKNILMLAFVILFFWATNVTASNDAEYKLDWGHYLGSGPFLEIEEEFVKNIEERTDGRVEINIAHSGALGKGREVFRLAGQGAIDMAAAPPGYYADYLPFWKAFQIPFLFKSPENAINVLRKSLEEFPIFKKEMDSLNVVWLFQQPLGEYYLTGEERVTTVEGLKGKKIRSFGEWIPKAHRAIGATPVDITAVDIYESLQKGIIDYSFLNIGNIPEYRLPEVGKYTIGPLQSFTGHNIVIGKPTWNKLPEKIQNIFLEEAEKAQEKYLDWLRQNSEEAINLIEEQGGEVVEFPQKEVEKWKNAMEPDLLTQWVENMEKKGHGDTAREVAKKWRKWIDE